MGDATLIIGAIIILFVACFGLISNTAAIFTIWNIPKRCRLFNHLLICLLSFDSWVLLTAPFFHFGANYQYFESTFCVWMVPYWSFPCGHMGTFGTILMTLAIAHERYLAIKDPQHYNQSIIRGVQEQKKRLLLYFLPVAFLSVILNIPRFFVFEVATNTTTTTLRLTDMGNNHNYLFYYTFLLNTIPFGILPFCTLIYLNYQTFRSLRKQRKSAQAMIVTTYSKKLQNNIEVERRAEEERMAYVMIAMVTAFLVCHSTRIFLNTYDGILGSRGGLDEDRLNKLGTHDAYGYAVDISILMVMVNSAIGPIIYCAISSDFRKQVITHFKQFTSAVSYRKCCVTSSV